MFSMNKLNYNSNFLRGSSKQKVLVLFFVKGYSFNLNITAIPRASPPGSPMNSIRGGGGRGLTGRPRLLATIYFPIHPKCRIFFLPG